MDNSKLKYSELIHRFNEYSVEQSYIFNTCIKLKQALYESHVKNEIAEIKQELGKNEEAITTITQFIQQLIKFCSDWIKSDNNASKDKELIAFINNLQELQELIDSHIAELKEDDPTSDNFINTVLDSYDNKIEEIYNKISDLERKAELTYAKESTVDNKLFSSTLNTISILGIFVAIAFAGFGSMSIFSNLNLDLKNHFTKSIFILIMVALLIYNIILMLLYFVYKLSKINSKPPITYDEKEKKQSSGLNLKPFIIIDIFMFIVFLAACVLIYCKLY